jgi:hypothetical protein
MKIENKMPYIQFHTNDWLNYTRDFSYITKGVLIDLLANTWNRECKWIKLDEIKEIALNRGLTLKQFDKVQKELWRQLTPNKEFKFTFMEKQREDAIRKSHINRNNALKKPKKNEDMSKRTLSDTNTYSKSETEKESYLDSNKNTEIKLTSNNIRDEILNDDIFKDDIFKNDFILEPIFPNKENKDIN